MARLGFVAGAIIIVVAAVFFGFRKAAREHAGADVKAAGSAAPKTPSPAAAGSARGGLPADSPLLRPRSIRRIDPESRKLLAEEIAQARARRTQAAPVVGGAPPPEMSKEYIQTQIRELVPLLEECYVKAREDDPQLAGKLAVKFAIGGEPDVGGLVESSEVDPAASTITHAGMIECVRETMYGAEFVAPPGGGRVAVHYAFEFSPTPR